MLQLKEIRKSYTTADFTQTALDGVSVAFRDNEFVAILGPSGSGKTTLLNIVGGLDHYDSGDLVIDGVSTKEYKDRDWDTYRNNRIGFVFQSYNLIPHQSVLENVELALTLSGVSRSERKQRAAEALQRVGLGEHLHKKPSQLSGGQMQRVAIARALINDPEILLADEPTGALDSKTSVQIMDLLTEIADDRLVIMVTHNPELAERYATRTVNLADGRITSDSQPFDPASAPQRAAKPARQAHMSFATALSLSFRNLMTKKGRTFMTAFAGSIGIIGIAAILALANGVNGYIEDIEEETLSEYPISVTSASFDMTELMTSALGTDVASSDDDDEDGVDMAAVREAVIEMRSGGDDDDEADEEVENDGTVSEVKILTSMFGSIGSNDLASLKEYLDGGSSGIESYVSAIEYTYDVTPQLYLSDTSDGVHQVNPDSTFSSLLGTSSSSLMSSYMSTDIFYQLPAAESLYEDQYEVSAGRWPTSYDEVVIVLPAEGTVSDYMLYVMGLRDPDELSDMVAEFIENDEVEDTSTDDLELSYDDLLDVSFKMVSSADYYVYDEEYDVYKDKTDDDDYMLELVEDGVDVHVVGVIAPDADATITSLSPGIYYTQDTIDYLVDYAAGTQIVKQQLDEPAINVFSGKSFVEEEEEDDSSSFDLNSMFTIDGDAITAAFTVDEDALTSGMSGLDLDLSDMSIDASSLQFDASSLELDASSMDLSDMDLSDMDLSSLSFDMSDLDISFEGVEPTVDTSALADAMGSAMSGFFTWYMQNAASYSGYEEAMSAYMATDEVSSALSEAIASSIDMSGMQDAISEQISEQISAQMQSAMTSAITEQIVPQLAAALSEQISSQLSTAVSSYMQEAMASMMDEIAEQLTEQVSTAMEASMASLSTNMASAMSIDEEAFADAFSMDMDEDELTELIMSLMSSEETSYEGNLADLDYADYDNPSQIDIYPVDFESKDQITAILDAYNDGLEEEGDEDKEITYTDIVGSLMSSVTTIVNMISYVLTAFVAISLVVSSIMIGIITYISVLERKKEIGILRSIGASKGDIGNVFNAETIIVGLAAGLIGIGITLLASLIVNPIVYGFYDVPNIMRLPATAAIVLVCISVVLTFVSGLLPSSAASRKDPVEALRSE